MPLRISSQRHFDILTGKVPRPRATHTASEEQEAMALIEWRNAHLHVLPELRMLFHIPNQKGTRSTREMARLKKMGVKAGVADYLLSVPRFTPVLFHGLYLELKAKNGRPSGEQKQFDKEATEHGYCYRVCEGWEAARDCLLWYLGDKD